MKFLMTILVLLAMGCANMKHSDDLRTVSQVDLPRFMGKWYVIASIPTFLEKGAHNAVEIYTWNEKEKRIDIDFTFHKNSPTGDLKSVPQKGFVYNPTTNAEWRVRPFWPLKFAYLILDLDAGYSHTIVGVPDRAHVWIMARTPSIPDELYQSLTKKIGDWGFDLKELRKVPQSWLSP